MFGSHVTLDGGFESMMFGSHVKQENFCLKVCHMVYPRVLPFLLHLLNDTSQFE